MKFNFKPPDPELEIFDSLPRIPLILRTKDREVETIALVDSGAMVNVLPLHLGEELGAMWDDSLARLELTGNFQNQPAIAFLAMAQVGDYEPVRLSFAWVKRNDVPLILGQVNFFNEFRVCFERYNLEFEVTPKPK